MLRRLTSAAGLLAILIPASMAEDFQARHALADPHAVRQLASFVEMVTEARLFDLARSALENHLVQSPEDAEAHLVAAQFYRSIGEGERAVQHASAALKFGRLDEMQTRRAAFLRAALDQRTEPQVLAAGNEPADLLSTASVTDSSERTRNGMDENVLERINGRSSRPAEAIARIAPRTQPIVPILALTDDSEQPGEIPAPRSSTTEAPADLSIRHTFSLY